MASSHINAEALRAQLLGWYRKHARDLPWRQYRTPYPIWVSEIMLQQTRVDTVVPFFERFLARWPTVHDLATADPEEVRALWSGLGYYRRAQSMLKSAKIIHEEHNGEFPSDIEILGKLPGFGPYTRGAVASIAFDKAVPAVDGNVMRVLARVAAVEGDVRKGVANRNIWALAAELAVGEAPGDFNQSLIELGALICRKAAQCERCPINSHCHAYRLQKVDQFPYVAKRLPPKVEYWTALLLHDDQQLVLQSRPDRGRFANMWCPILLEGHLDVPSAQKAATALGISLTDPRLRPTVTHILTHRRLETTLYTCALPKELPSGARLISFSELGSLGLPRFTCKLIEAGLPGHLVPSNLPGRIASTGSTIRQPFFPFEHQEPNE
ncbi:MAG: A/G-specific adenine glycosylase [Myxococcales bacterium]|nr:A/G-specific adenine glycosylase [Myxococcales bacterium]